MAEFNSHQRAKAQPELVPNDECNQNLPMAEALNDAEDGPDGNKIHNKKKAVGIHLLGHCPASGAVRREEDVPSKGPSTTSLYGLSRNDGSAWKARRWRIV
ncbi:hypothetical protein QOT17_024776 [Balamuthia mandrillaris]